MDRGWDSRWGKCPRCALLLSVSSKEIFRFWGSSAIVFSRRFLTFTKACERHSGLSAEGEGGVPSPGVLHLHVPLWGTPHSTQCHLGLSCSTALPWGHLHPPSWEDSWEGHLGEPCAGPQRPPQGWSPHARTLSSSSRLWLLRGRLSTRCTRYCSLCLQCWSFSCTPWALAEESWNQRENNPLGGKKSLLG